MSGGHHQFERTCLVREGSCASAKAPRLTTPQQPQSQPQRARRRTQIAAALVACLLATVSAGATVSAQTQAQSPAAQPRSTPKVNRTANASAVPSLNTNPSGITRDIGNIAVIEHDGSNYDKNFLPARPQLMRRFYETHGNNYDFLVTFTNFEFDTGDALAFHVDARNTVAGIGKPVSGIAGFEQAPSRLQGMVDMAAIDRYRHAPQSLTPGSPDFNYTLNVVAHEIAHQWLANVRYRTAQGGTSSDLLGKDGVHWSYLLDSDASVMYGSDWSPLGNGQYRADAIQRGYSSLDLYLMGLLNPAKVAPFTLLRNPSISPLGIPHEGDVISADAESIDIAQVIAAEGARVPDYVQSPKAFRVGFVFLTAKGVEPDPVDLKMVDVVRRRFAAHFFALTQGVATADTTLAEAAPINPAPFPDLDRALAWLVAKQGLDGRFQDSIHTTVRDTSAGLDAFVAAGVGGAPRDRALAFLQGSFVSSVDALSRRAVSLSGSMQAPERASLAAVLLSLQNTDGGFGAAQGFATDALDTALALRALKALASTDTLAVRKAIGALGLLAKTDGGWASVVGGDTSTVATSTALAALLDWKDQPQAASPLAAGMGALTTRQNDDGGFGESPSTPYATALALDVLVNGGASVEVTNRAISWLQNQQQIDGNWVGGRYPTALVLSALKGGVTPNLTVPADNLVVPSSAQEGEIVEVTARIMNTGRVAAGPSLARLFDGSPSLGDLLDEKPVPSLPPGEFAVVTFHMATQGRAGPRLLNVYADAQEDVKESREDDNVTGRLLQITGPLPDLTILPGDLTAAPIVAEEGETLAVNVRVTNAGTKSAGVSRVRVFDGDPQKGGRLIADVAVPPLEPSASTPVSAPWDTTGLLGNHVLFALADATYVVAEVDEYNNQMSAPVTVTGPLPPGPDFELLSLTASPARLTTLPQQITLRAVVRNLGRDAASFVVRFQVAPPAGVTPIADIPVSLPGRSSVTLNVAASVTTAGGRTLTAVVDPDDTIPETEEGNNRATAFLGDPGNIIDIEVLPSDVHMSATDLVAGETLDVTATVRNKGTTPLAEVPLTLGVGLGTDFRELARTTVAERKRNEGGAPVKSRGRGAGWTSGRRSSGAGGRA